MIDISSDECDSAEFQMDSYQEVSSMKEFLDKYEQNIGGFHDLERKQVSTKPEHTPDSQDTEVELSADYAAGPDSEASLNNYVNSDTDDEPSTSSVSHNSPRGSSGSHVEEVAGGTGGHAHDAMLANDCCHCHVFGYCPSCQLPFRGPR